jgi:predicted ATPase
MVPPDRGLVPPAARADCVEDLQWADPTSRELLDLIIERLESWPVLLIATFRSEFRPPWSGQPAVTAILLNRLNRRNSAMLVKGLIGAEARLPNDVADAIVERCDGVPLFLERADEGDP